MTQDNDPSAVRTFNAPGLCVSAVSGDPDVLAYYNPNNPQALLVMRDPIDVREWR